MAHILAPRSTKKSFFYVFLVWAYSNLHHGLDFDSRLSGLEPRGFEVTKCHPEEGMKRNQVWNEASVLNHGELVCTNNDNVCGSLQFRDCKFRCIPHTEEAFHPPKKVKSLLKRPKQKKCNGMEELFKRSQWQRISKMYKKRRVFGRTDF